MSLGQNILPIIIIANNNKFNTVRIYGLHKNVTIEIFFKFLKELKITGLKSIKIFKNYETKQAKFAEIQLYNSELQYKAKQQLIDGILLGQVVLPTLVVPNQQIVDEINILNSCTVRFNKNIQFTNKEFEKIFSRFGRIIKSKLIQIKKIDNIYIENNQGDIQFENAQDLDQLLQQENEQNLVIDNIEFNIVRKQNHYKKNLYMSEFYDLTQEDLKTEEKRQEIIEKWENKITNIASQYTDFRKVTVKISEEQQKLYAFISYNSQVGVQEFIQNYQTKNEDILGIGEPQYLSQAQSYGNLFNKYWELKNLQENVTQEDILNSLKQLPVVNIQIKQINNERNAIVEFSKETIPNYEKIKTLQNLVHDVNQVDYSGPKQIPKIEIYGHQKSKQINNKIIFVGNIKKIKNEKEVREAFEDFGDIDSIQMNNNLFSSKQLKSATIKFNKAEVCDKIINRFNSNDSRNIKYNKVLDLFQNKILISKILTKEELKLQMILKRQKKIIQQNKKNNINKKQQKLVQHLEQNKNFIKQDNEDYIKQQEEEEIQKNKQMELQKKINEKFLIIQEETIKLRDNKEEFLQLDFDKQQKALNKIILTTLNRFMFGEDVELIKEYYQYLSDRDNFSLDDIIKLALDEQSRQETLDLLKEIIQGDS